MEKITSKLAERQVFLKMYSDSFDEEALEHSIQMPVEVDILSKEIKDLLKENLNDLTCDFIIETITHLGGAPSILYDDNGNFAVTDDGYQPVVTGDELLEGPLTFIVKKEMWKPTIREAVTFYINSH